MLAELFDTDLEIRDVHRCTAIGDRAQPAGIAVAAERIVEQAGHHGWRREHRNVFICRERLEESGPVSNPL